MKKIITREITAATVLTIMLGMGLYAYASNNTTQDDKFLQDWNKAGIKKLEEKTKKEQAEKLLKEAEAARVEKEKLLGIVQDGTGKLSH